MYNLNMNSNLAFGDGFSASVFALFNSPRTTLQGKSSSWSMMSVGLKKELFDKKGSIGLSVTNPYKKHQEFNRDLTGANFTQNSVFGFEFRRSEEHTSELQSLMRISYAVFCLKKKKNN